MLADRLMARGTRAHAAPRTRFVLLGIAGSCLAFWALVAWLFSG